MIAVYARCVVTGQHVDEFLELATKLVEETRKEPEVISYELVRGREGRNVFAFMEKWPSQAVLDAHMRTEHFRTLIPKIQRVVIGKIDIVTHEVLI